MENPLFAVYKNLEAFIKFRGLKTSHEFKLDDSGRDRLVNLMESAEYINISCDSNTESKEANKTTLLLMLSPESGFSKSTPKLKTLLEKFEN